MSVQTVNTNTDLDASKLHLIKVGDKKYDVRYDEDKKYLALEIAPESERLADSFFCFGIKQKESTSYPQLGIVLEGFQAFNTIDLLNLLQDKISQIIDKDQKLNSILYDNSNSYVLNLTTRWNKNTNKILTSFTYADGTTAELPYDKSFRGIYYVLVESVTLSKNGT